VRRLFVASLFLVFATAVACFGDVSSARRIDRCQLTAFLTGGISNTRLQRLVSERGVSFSLSAQDEKQFRSAGADSTLIKALRNVRPSGPAQTESFCALDLEKVAELAHTKKYDKAEALLENLIRTSAANSDLHFALGELLSQQQLWDKAFDEFTESARLMPDFPETHNRLAYLFSRSDDADNTIAEARTALSMDPRNAEAYRYLGLGLYALGKYDAALHAYEQSLIREAENADVYYDIGIVLRDRGDLRGAAAAYRHALRLKPAFWEAHSNLGIVMHDLGRLDDAIAQYREAKRLAPDESSVRNNLGNTFCDKGQYDAAIAEFRELYRMDAGWESGHSCMARAFMAKKDYASAISELRVTVRQNPTGASEHRVLGQTLLLAGKPEEALQELQSAVYLSPDSALAHHYLGTALFELQSLEEAEKQFREALRLEPTASNHYSLAACLMTMNRNDEALSELEIASHLDPAQSLYRARKEELLKLMAPGAVR
jgi:tetratricopeptide (TPR) repeat protein